MCSFVYEAKQSKHAAVKISFNIYIYEQQYIYYFKYARKSAIVSVLIYETVAI